jgi:hypothetical protein
LAQFAVVVDKGGKGTLGNLKSWLPPSLGGRAGRTHEVKLQYLENEIEAKAADQFFRSSKRIVQNWA